jgi:hypothetical protein
MPGTFERSTVQVVKDAEGRAMVTSITTVIQKDWGFQLRAWVISALNGDHRLQWGFKFIAFQAMSVDHCLELVGANWLRCCTGPQNAGGKVA